jgi:serine phosphatase RsbU (regulator of sigma subunit)
MAVSLKSRTEASATGRLTGPVDVLVISPKPLIEPRIANILASQCVTFDLISLQELESCTPDFDLIGTVILDASGLSLSQQKKLRPLVKEFESHGVAVTLLNGWADLGPDLALLGTLFTATIEELWGRIQANLSHRKYARSQKGRLQPGPSDTVSEQLKMAGQVQRDFLPAALPQSESLNWISIFKPAEWVSGDIFDVARLDETHIGFYIADAVGHSLPAALLTMFLKQALTMRETHGSTYRIFEPIEVISNLNRHMVEQKLSGCQFATCCYCLLNTTTFELSMCRAGHPYPLLIHPDANIQQIQSRGSLLGIFEETQYTQEKVQLAKGDKLILYSDGLEPLIGKTDPNARFNFTKIFRGIAGLKLKDFAVSFDRVITENKPKTAEFDDITLLGLEIL